MVFSTMLVLFGDRLKIKISPELFLLSSIPQRCANVFFAKAGLPIALTGQLNQTDKHRNVPICRLNGVPFKAYRVNLATEI